jgi:predicted small lipoprotein YifL
MSADRGRRWLAVLTIFVIAGTLTSCGRYGRPVRPLPDAETASDSAVDSSEGSSEESGESDMSEELEGSDEPERSRPQPTLGDQLLR